MMLLFTVAVGNDGEHPSPFNRIQSPSDLVNGLGVGAYCYNNEGEKEYARYSCVGEGREGCKVKPDLSAFGGDDVRLFQILSATGQVCLTAGTSFASPLAARVCGQLIASSEDITPNISRALLIHNAVHPDGGKDNYIGHGFMNDDIFSILECSDTKVTVLYSGVLEPKRYFKVHIPLPEDLDVKSNVRISWTITTTTNVNILDTDSYAQRGIHETFYPHDLKHNMTKDGKSKVVHLEKDRELIEKLINEGYNLSDLPKSDSVKHGFKTERQLRNEDLKWDTVVTKAKIKRYSSLRNPSMVLHAMERFPSDKDPVKYAIAVTIEIPKYEGNLYSDVVTRSRAQLRPIGIQNVIEERIRI